MYMNKVTLVGFTAAEAKHTNAQGGKGITRFSLATTKRFKTGNEWKDNTQWHDCVVYKISLKATQTIQKGDHLLIEGELSYREYERTIETPEGPVQVQIPKRKSLSTRSLGSTDQRNRKREPLRRRRSLSRCFTRNYAGDADLSFDCVCGRYIETALQINMVLSQPWLTRR